MLYEGWAWGAIAAIALLTVDTGGGGHVGGDADPERDFIGRDSAHGITFNNYLEQKQRKQRRGDDPNAELPGTLEERVEWHNLAIFGDSRLGVPGLRDLIRDLRTEIVIGRAVVAGLTIIVLVQTIIIFYLLGAGT